MSTVSATQSAGAFLAIFALSASAAGAQVDTAPNGVPQTLATHVANRVAPHSALPPVQIIQTFPLGAPIGRPYGGTAVDVTSYHYDNYRTGWNPTETDLTPATVASSNFGLLANLPVDGNVFAQPLLVSGYTMPDSTVHDVLIVATGNNSVYAFDAKTYALLWHVNLGQQQSTNDVGCGDVQGGYGISSTPIIVRSGASATLYLVAAIEPAPYSFHSMLHALDLGSGADVIPPVEIHPSAKLSNKATLNFDPQNQWSRASLAYNNGSLYVSIGSHCDNSAYSISGWILQYSAALTLQNSFHTIYTPHGYELASIWMSGFAPAIDPSGNLFVVTGNGDLTLGGAKDWGESVLKLTPTLTTSSYFTPYAYNSLNAGDVDFGSGGVMLIPHIANQKAADTAVAMGKASVLYLLRQSSLSGLSVNDKNAAQVIQYGGGGVWGGPAYYGGPTGQTIYYQSGGDVLRSFSLATSTTSPKLTLSHTGTTGAGYGGSLPIVSSNGSTAGTGVVWIVRRSAPIELEAYNATSLGAPIYSANIGAWSNPSNNNPFLTAMEADGRVYVGSYLSVQVFGLAQ